MAQQEYSAAHGPVNNKHYWGTAAPTAGTYLDGDICWNTAPAAGGAAFWVCTTPGSPGTWKAVNCAA
jgi:hypothetical protein